MDPTAENKQLRFIPLRVQLVLGSTYLLIILAVSLIVPIIELAIGSSYRNDCPINHHIPTYLIVAGALGLVVILLLLAIVAGFICIIKRMSIIATFAISCVIAGILVIVVVLGSFLFVWFIVGNVWVFRVKNNVVFDNPVSLNYCHPTLYNFAFAILILSYILPFIGCLVQCIVSCCQSK